MERRHDVLVGTVVDVASATRTIIVKTADGTEHTLLFATHNVVHGFKDVGHGAGDAFHGLEKRSKVAVHYTAYGVKETADEVDRVGDDGLKAAKVTVTHFDRGPKTVSVKTEDGAEETFRVTGPAAEEFGKRQRHRTTAKGTIYFSNEAGHKVAHFFERAI